MGGHKCTLLIWRRKQHVQDVSYLHPQKLDAARFSVLSGVTKVDIQDQIVDNATVHQSPHLLSVGPAVAGE